MSPIFPVDGRFLAFGLSWLTFTGDKAEKAAKARASEDNFPYMVGRKGAAGGRFGFLNDLDTEATNGKPKKGRLLSGAALFAAREDVAENAIFIHPYKPLGSDQRVAAVVALYQGEVFEDRAAVRLGDIHKHIAKLTQDIADFAETESGEPPQFQHYTTDPDQFPEAARLPLDALCEGDTSTAVIVDARSYLGIRLLMVVILLAMAGSMGWQKYQDYQRRLALERQPVQQQGPSPAELYQRSLDTQLRQVGVTPATFAAIANKALGERETIVEGYRLVASNCTDAAGCTEIWERIDGVGILEGFLAANEGAVIAPDGNSGNLKLTYRLTVPRVGTTRQVLPKQEDFSVFLTSLVQRYSAIGITTKTEALKLFGVPAGVQESVLPRGIGVGASNIEITGPAGYLWDLLSDEIDPELKLPTNFYVTEIGFEALNGAPTAAKFKLKGTYYVQQ